MTVFKKTKDNQCWWGCGQKEALYTVDGNVISTDTQTVWIFLKDLKTEAPCDTVVPTPWYTAEANEISMLRDIICTDKFPVRNSQEITINFSIHQLMNVYRKCGIYTHNRTLISHKREWNPEHWSNINGTGAHYN
jgi:hypothetical protein